MGNLNLGWVYMFMGIIIGSAVIPIWNMMTWDRASGKGAVIAAWSGLCLALIAWFVTATVQSGSISVATLGKNEPMFTGNVVAICSSGLIHYIYSKCFDNEVFDFSTLNDKLTLVENDMAGLGEEQMDLYSWMVAYDHSRGHLASCFYSCQSFYARLFCVLGSDCCGVGIFSGFRLYLPPCVRKSR